MESDTKADTYTRVGAETTRTREKVEADGAESGRQDAESMASSFLKNMSQSLKQRTGGEKDSAGSRHSEHRRSSRSPRRTRGHSPTSMTAWQSSRDDGSARTRREHSRDDRGGYRDSRERRRGERDQPRRRSRSRDGRRPRSRDGGRRPRTRSPRRRRSRSREGSVPTVPLHLRAKKLGLWDMAPPGFEGVSCAEAKASGVFPPPGQAAGSRNVASFNPSVLFEHTHRNENDRFRPSSRGEREFPSTASRQARRLYVGNIPLGIDEDSIAVFFNDLMVRLNIAPREELPVQNIQINADKNYAFVEVRDATQATMGMGLDGVMFHNQKLKIRRPKDYIPPPGEPEPAPPVFALPGAISNTVPDTPNKVYVGGLPTYLSEDQVIELLRAFGELRAFNLVKDSATRLSRGFAFCEYEDPAVTDLACQGLNRMDLGDKRLVVQRASLGARGAQPPQNQHQNYNQNQSQRQHHQGRPPRHAPDGAYANSQMPLQMPSAPVAPATTVVQLLNMVTERELADDDEYADIVDDVGDECSNYGAVVELRIPRSAPGVGKIFVRYASDAEATAALNALAGRQFMGRTVIATYITEEDLASQNY
ncbi:hypothetical protein IWW48_002834 [Coemansia sp. RSA 1200]|nr:hypothetical protein IWW48_002834 [Coemansia sp. RSA 1200]